jgi:hypothetical protein
MGRGRRDEDSRNDAVDGGGWVTDRGWGVVAAELGLWLDWLDQIFFGWGGIDWLSDTRCNEDGYFGVTRPYALPRA